MSKELTYRDAVKLLGGEQSTVLAALDKAAGAGLLGAALAGVPAALGLIDAKAELVRLGADLISGLKERARRKATTARTDLLVAAHMVLLLTAFWETLDKAVRPTLGGRKLDLTQKDISNLIRERPNPHMQSWSQARVLPAAHKSYEENLEAVRGLYEGLARSALSFLQGLSGWDRIDETARVRMSYMTTKEVPGSATNLYAEYYLRLASDVPEFFVWASMQESTATRRLINELRGSVEDVAASTRSLTQEKEAADSTAALAQLERLLVESRTGLGGLRQLLGSLPAASTDVPSEVWRSLAARYDARLIQPILEAGRDESLAGVCLPLLRSAYVNHRYKVAEIGPAARPAEHRFWSSIESRDDFQGFLAGHLTSAAAVERPLVILGHPGSGKSVLTQVLAGQLPKTMYAVVRVELRRVPADATLQRQIEHAIYDATGEEVTWPQLVRVTASALPVIILDGLDELVQNSRAQQGPFLEHLREFQQRELEIGRRVAIVVTSRAIGMESVRFPSDCIVVHLQPFDDVQIRAWLGIWNATNEQYLREHKLAALLYETVKDHGALAEQPLLLLMLALFDIDGNALQRKSGTFERTDLYEGLLRRFVRREVNKQLNHLADTDARHRIDAELLRLAVVAFGMFNRGTQAIAAAEVDADLSALGVEQMSNGPHETVSNVGLTPARLLVGRFFFIHESRADIVDAGLIQTYEFLHATFGEYLVARLTAEALSSMILQEESRRREIALLMAARPLDDSFLHALLSWSLLSARTPVMIFLQGILSRMSPQDRTVLSEILPDLLRRNLNFRPADQWTDYRPVHLVDLERLATYDANLVLLYVAALGLTTARAVLGETHDTLALMEWSQHARLWQSQLPESAWMGLSRVLVARRLQTEEGLDLILEAIPEDAGPEDADLADADLEGADAEDGSPGEEHVALRWPFRRFFRESTGRSSPSIVSYSHVQTITRRASLTISEDQDYLLHVLEPLLLGGGWFASVLAREHDVAAVARLLLDVAIGLSTAEERMTLYDDVLDAMQILQFHPTMVASDARVADHVIAVLLRRLRDEASSFAPERLGEYLVACLGLRMNAANLCRLAECIVVLGDADRKLAIDIARTVAKDVLANRIDRPELLFEAQVLLMEAGLGSGADDFGRPYPGLPASFASIDVRLLIQSRPSLAVRALRIAGSRGASGWLSDRWVPILDEMPDDFLSRLSFTDVSALLRAGAPNKLVTRLRGLGVDVRVAATRRD